jgi:murein DD-endopeptidase MepM/ murein hydrolase activator NlpD
VTSAKLNPVLDRIWVVKTITHNVAARTTTLNVTSPVESKNVAPAPVTPTKPDGKPTTAGKAWVYPVTGSVTSLWNPRRRHPTTGEIKPHRGVDIGAATGTAIYSAADGHVTRKFYDSAGGGNVLTIQHDNGYCTQYLHMNTAGIPQVGQRVLMRELIGEVGNTGIGSGSHLHFETWFGKTSDRDAASANPVEIFSKLGTVGNSCIANTLVK